ncbi:MAG: sulfatase-like hydrolase/transferase [Spirochaetota bacterium]
MNKRNFFYLLLLLFASYVLVPGTVIAQAKDKPNIVLILVDDSGLMDFGTFGGEAKTPHIDRLARQGTMLTNFHASPVCAPSRAMLVTGIDSHLTGVANLPEMLPSSYENQPGYQGVLNNRVQTVATRLKEVGYRTYVSGKWHLGHDKNTLPPARGFDRSFILAGSGASNYQTKGYLPFKMKAQWFADGKETSLPDNFYSSKDYIQKTIAFHETEENKNSPFFSYIAFQALQAPQKFVKPYLEVYQEGWDVLRQKRFAKAKAMGIIPATASMNDMFPQFQKWEELSPAEKEQYTNDMAVLAGMLEAMDHYIGQYIKYLQEKGLYQNTIFIIASDNGPDGGNYNVSLMQAWRKSQGYHRDKSRIGEKGYFGAIGPEFAYALASPFSFFKYYAGEGGVRTPLIISGKNIPGGQQSNEFCFITDVVPTILELAGMEAKSNKLYTQITGKSLLPHLKNLSVPVYQEDEGVGMEAANSASYYQGDFKIVKNNIPLGDNKWYMYNLRKDPGETKDISKMYPEKFTTMITSYTTYAKAVGVIAMEEGYSAEKEVGKKSVKKVLLNLSMYPLGFFVFVIAMIGYWKKRKSIASV